MWTSEAYIRHCVMPLSRFSLALRMHPGDIMITAAVYKELKDKYGAVASWALWSPAGTTKKSNTADLSIFDDPDLLVKLNPKYVFVALNAANHPNPQSLPAWSCFHSSYRYQNDYKLRTATQGTRFEGAYITDIIKYYVETDSNKKGDYYLIDESIVDGLTILGIRDINWESFSSDSNILQGSQGYGIYDFLSQNYGLDDIGMLQMRADHVSLFNRGIYPIFEYPNKIQLKTATGANITKGLDRFPIDLLIQHPDNLTTISPTKMEIFEELAKADVAVFLYEYLKHYDGLESVFSNIDLKLASIESAASKRDDVISQLKDSYVSASNDAQPIWLCV